MKKVVCTMLMSLMALVVVAQERAENRLGWNVALQGGAHYSAFENTKHESFGNSVNGHVALSVGYDFSHVFGTRVEVSYGKNTSGTNTKQLHRPVVLYHCKDVSFFADAIFNLSNLLSKDRRTNFEVEAKGYVGLGVGIPNDGEDHNVHGYFSGSTSTAMGVRAGVICEWHATQNWGFFVDGRTTGYADKFNGTDSGFPLDMRLGLSVGAIYHF